MYSNGDHVRAVKRHIKLDKRTAATIRQLAYPTNNAQELASGIRTMSRSAGALRALEAEVFVRAEEVGGRPLSRSWSLYDRDKQQGTRPAGKRLADHLDCAGGD